MPTGAEINAAFQTLSGRTFTRDQLSTYGLLPVLDNPFVNDSAKAGVRPQVGAAWYRYGDANAGDYGGMEYVTADSFGGQAVGQLGSIGPNGEYGAYNARLTWNPDGTYTLGDVGFVQTANNANATLFDWVGNNLSWIGPVVLALAAPYAAPAVFEVGAGAGIGAAELGGVAGSVAAQNTALAAASGWVSAEGGAGYLGGQAADTAALTAGNPAALTSGVTDYAASGWVSAEGGAGYLGGQAADAPALAAGNPAVLASGAVQTIAPAVTDYAASTVVTGAGATAGTGTLGTALTAAGAQLLGNAGNALLGQALAPNGTDGATVQAPIAQAGTLPLLLLGIAAVLFLIGNK